MRAHRWTPLRLLLLLLLLLLGAICTRAASLHTANGVGAAPVSADVVPNRAEQFYQDALVLYNEVKCLPSPLRYLPFHTSVRSRTHDCVRWYGLL